ncbi:MAG: hypothetical protein J2P41_21740, partial [Blastocatellia bacterium]|nr:hypothetical protein [Blastocatellia bacterium]
MASVTQSDGKFPAHSQVEQVVLPHIWSLSDNAIKIVTTCLMIFDGLLSSALFILAYWLRHPAEPPFLPGKWQIGPIVSHIGFHPGFGPYLSVLYFVPFIQIVTFSYRGLYRVRGEFSFLDDFINIFKAISTGMLLTTMIAFFYRGGFE